MTQVSINLHKFASGEKTLPSLTSWLLNWIWKQNRGSAEEFFPQFAGVTYSHGYLSQGALHGPQEVGISEAVVPRADVVQFKAEPLDLLKVVVHQEDLGEDRTAATADHLCAVHL